MSYNTKCLNSAFDGVDPVFDEKPPAPPVRLASARELNANNCNSVPLDMRPLPKAPEEDKKALKKSKLRSSMKRSNENSNGHSKKDHGQTVANNSGGGFHYGKNSEKSVIKPIISPPSDFQVGYP